MAGAPQRAREFRYCPNCGSDLEPLKPKRVGDLYADPLGDTYWKGQQVRLSTTERLIVDSLITMREFQSRRDPDSGYFAPALAIAERADINVDTMKVVMSGIRAAFRQADPDFNHIETANGGGGWRWAGVNVRRSIASSPRARLTLYDNGEVDWGIYRIHLTAQEARAFALLIKAQGQMVSASALAAVTDAGTLRMGYRVVERIRRKFREADASTTIIHTRPKPSRFSRGGFYLGGGSRDEPIRCEAAGR